MSIQKTELYFDDQSKLALLSSLSGLALHASGNGLVASTNGVNGTASIALPVTINQGDRFHFRVLVQTDGSDLTNAASAQIAATDANSPYGQRVYSGVRTQVDNGLTVGTAGGSTNVNHSMYNAFPAGRYWLGATSDGVTVTAYAMPEGHFGINEQGNAYSSTRADAFTATSSADQFYGVAVFDHIVDLLLSNASSSNKILGVYVCVGGLEEPVDARLAGPWIHRPIVNGDNTVFLRHPGGVPKGLVTWDHPNESDEFSGQRASAVDSGAAAAHLVASGYAIIAGRGDPTTYFNSATANPWGGPGISTRKAFVDWYRSNVGIPSARFWVGQSMGGINGLAYHRVYHAMDPLDAYVGICPVTNLQYANDHEGPFPISTGLQGNTIASVDPMQHAADFATLPIKIWHGDADTLIHSDHHAIPFVAAVTSAGGNAVAVSVSGGGHLDTAAEYDGPGMLAFFVSAITGSSSSSSSLSSASSQSSSSSSSHGYSESSSSEGNHPPLHENPAQNSYPSVLINDDDPGHISKVDETVYQIVRSSPFTGSVTLDLDTDYANSEIRYTLNGKNPKDTSLLYKTPLVFTRNMLGEHSTVKARIYDKTNKNKKGKIIRITFRIVPPR